MSDKIIDVPAESDSPQAVVVRDAQQAIQALEKASDKPQVTAAQAKVEAIADLTKSAYARASELRLSAEESAALQAEFPDEAFKPGAAGKTELLYIEHAFLRDRLNRVFGIGQWSIIPRSRWAEDYSFVNKYNKTVEASRVFVEAMLLVRGCFCSEAVGEMTYYKNNEGQNYADAVEGAKTAALRRCCKELGVDLQAWKKDWCAGWWERHNANREGTARQQPTTRIEHPRNQAPSEAPKTQTKIVDGVYPSVEVLTVEGKPKDKKDETGKVIKSWVSYKITFSDGFGELVAWTFDKKIADIANDLANTRERGNLRTKPGKDPKFTDIVSLERADSPPPITPKDEDNVPFAFDDAGQPIQEVTP